MTTFTYFQPDNFSFDVKISGHSAIYLKSILECAAEHPSVTRLRTVVSPALSNYMMDVIKSTGSELRVLTSHEIYKLSSRRGFLVGIRQWGIARQLLAETGGQLFIPKIDSALYGLIAGRRLIRGQISGILFSRPDTYINQKDLKHPFLRVATKMRSDVRCLYTLDERAVNPALSRIFKELTWLPELVPVSKLPLETRQPDERRRKVFLMFGSLGARKGLFESLLAVRHLPPARREQIALRYIGFNPDGYKVTEHFIREVNQTLLDCPEIEIYFNNSYVPVEKLAEEVLNCDVVLLPYQDHDNYSSNAIFWATCAGKPVIAPNTGLMSYMVNKYSLGTTIDVMKPGAIAMAMQAEIPEPSPQCVEKWRNVCFPENFGRLVLKGIFED